MPLVSLQKSSFGLSFHFAKKPRDSVPELLYKYLISEQQVTFLKFYFEWEKMFIIHIPLQGVKMKQYFSPNANESVLSVWHCG